MKAIPTSALALILLAAARFSRGEPESYLPGPDSKPQPGVPQGTLIGFDFAKSQVFPGTTRHVTVYVPRQYDPAKPACVYVDQDGVQFEAPVVLDNLIARGELPIIIGVFVTPGIVTALDPATALSRYNRSFEYDGLGDAYARLILDEVLPEVETKSTADGRAVHLSHSGNDRAIGGSSSGAIAAFNAAWERPEAFSRVLSAIGTYVGLRGADRFPTLIRKYEPKPIRVFLQDGSHDLNIYGGDWWMANQTMERALEFSGYEVSHVWGEESHNGKHITAVLPDALRWLWKDWPTPVARGQSKNGALKALLIPGEEWQVEIAGGSNTRGIFFNPQAQPYYLVLPNGRAPAEPSEGKAGPAARGPGSARFGPDGREYEGGAGSSGGIIAISGDSKITTVTEDLVVCDLALAHNGDIYATESGKPGAPGNVWRVHPDGSKQIVDTGLRSPTGITLSPDQSLLYVADGGSHWVYSYQIQPDGTLADKQRYDWLHSADTEDESHAGGMCCDKAGWLYVATDLGIQVCDQAGRVNAILPPPSRPVTSVCFGGPKFDTLYATCGDAIYRRRMNAVGANPWDPPSVPPVPKL